MGKGVTMATGSGPLPWPRWIQSATEMTFSWVKSTSNFLQWHQVVFVPYQLSSQPNQTQSNLWWNFCIWSIDTPTTGTYQYMCKLAQEHTCTCRRLADIIIHITVKTGMLLWPKVMLFQLNVVHKDAIYLYKYIYSIQHSTVALADYLIPASCANPIIVLVKHFVHGRWMCKVYSSISSHCSGRFRNLERGFGHWGANHVRIFWVATPTSGHLNVFMIHAIIVVAS